MTDSGKTGLSRTISKLVENRERHQADESAVERRKSQQRAEVIDHWNEIVDSALIPLLKEVEEHESFAGGGNLQAHLSRKSMVVSLRIESGRRRETLRFSLNADQGVVTVSGVPKPQGLSQMIEHESEHIQIGAFTRLKVQEEVEDFVKYALNPEPEV